MNIDRLKSSLLICMVLILCIAPGCDDDRNQIQPRNPQLIELGYDTQNVSAPTLEAGSYEGAARFVASQIRQFNGAQISEIDFFLALLPDACSVKIYSGGSPSEPGTLVYSADVSTEIQPASWNTHRLTDPVVIDNADIWVSIAFTHSSQRATLGCDAGPAFENGDWLFADSDQQWIPLSDRTPIDINWNIRALVDPN